MKIQTLEALELLRKGATWTINFNTRNGGPTEMKVNGRLVSNPGELMRKIAKITDQETRSSYS